MLNTVLGKSEIPTTLAFILDIKFGEIRVGKRRGRGGVYQVGARRDGGCGKWIL